MQITISARHGHLGAETQEKITEKLEKLPRLFERITAVVATCDLEHSESPEVELRVSVEKADDIVACEKTDSFWGAVDGAIHKVEQQLRKLKEKLKNHKRPGHRRQELPIEGEGEGEQD